jgi:hypothetical protein
MEYRLDDSDSSCPNYTARPGLEAEPQLPSAI